MTDGAQSCAGRVYWWDGEYEGYCERPEGHDGPHWDGQSWFNDDNEQADPPPLQWHYGPTATDPDPGAMWCYVCRGRVSFHDGAAVCGCGSQEEIEVAT